jgi:hypothetical protein
VGEGILKKESLVTLLGLVFGKTDTTADDRERKAQLPKLVDVLF